MRVGDVHVGEGPGHVPQLKAGRGVARRDVHVGEVHVPDAGFRQAGNEAFFRRTSRPQARDGDVVDIWRGCRDRPRRIMRRFRRTIGGGGVGVYHQRDRKSTRLNSSH